MWLEWTEGSVLLSLRNSALNSMALFTWRRAMKNSAERPWWSWKNSTYIRTIPSNRQYARVVNLCSSFGHLSVIPGRQLRDKFSSPDLTVKELDGLMRQYIEYTVFWFLKIFFLSFISFNFFLSGIRLCVKGLACRRCGSLSCFQSRPLRTDSHTATTIWPRLSPGDLGQWRSSRHPGVFGDACPWTRCSGFIYTLHFNQMKLTDYYVCRSWSPGLVGPIASRCSRTQRRLHLARQAANWLGQRTASIHLLNASLPTFWSLFWAATFLSPFSEFKKEKWFFQVLVFFLSFKGLDSGGWVFRD